MQGRRHLVIALKEITRGAMTSVTFGGLQRPSGLWSPGRAPRVVSRREHMDAFGELTCRELVELVTDYLEGALSPEERMRFEDHLLICEGCSAYVDQVRQTISLVGALQEDSIPPPVRDQLLAAFRSWKSGGSSGERELE